MARFCLIFLNILFIVLWQKVFSNTIPKIAIVGGGIGGTSSAYFLRKSFQEKASISLFERSSIGGRLNLINIDGNYYESGGSIIHPRNQYMLQFAKILGLNHRQQETSKLGIYDGEKFVFRESDWTFITMARFLWRYGISIFHLKQLVQSMLNDFSSIYDAQNEGLAFTTVSGMLEYMNPKFRNMTQESVLTLLGKEGYSGLLLEELVQSIMMVNYGQTNAMSGFAGFVSLAGADPELWSIKGGNKLVPEGLLQEAKVPVINGNVVEIAKLENGTFNLKYNETYGNGKLKWENYDLIIIAAPLIKGSKTITFTNFTKSFDAYEATYHRTVATFVEGDLNPSAFNTDSVPEEIFTFKDTLLFNSLGKVKPVTDAVVKGNDVYKIFSQRPLMYEEIKSLFKNVGIVKVQDWLAYPHYKPPEYLPPFMLYPGLYYTNAIELSASAMEMSVIAGRNIALLADNMWKNRIDLIDSNKHVYKDEL